MNEQKQFLSVDDLASRYGISKDTVYLWRYKGDGPPAMKIGRHLRYRLSDVEKWEEGQKDR